MLFSLALAAGAVALPVLSPAGAVPEQQLPKELLFQAYRDVLDSTTFAHVLMSAVQARLQCLKWGFGGWGLMGNKRAVQEEYDRMGARIREFRVRADALETGNADPMASERLRFGKESREGRAPDKMPDTVYEQVQEILRLRKTEYDADVSRSSLIRAENALRRLGESLGPLRLSPGQEQALGMAQSIHDELLRFRASTRASLPAPKKHPSGRDLKGRELVTKDLEELETDATDLSAEISRMRILFMLNNILVGGSPPADAQPDASGGKGGTR